MKWLLTLSITISSMGFGFAQSNASTKPVLYPSSVHRLLALRHAKRTDRELARVTSIGFSNHSLDSTREKAFHICVENMNNLDALIKRIDRNLNIIAASLSPDLKAYLLIYLDYLQHPKDEKWKVFENKLSLFNAYAILDHDKKTHLTIGQENTEIKRGHKNAKAFFKALKNNASTNAGSVY